MCGRYSLSVPGDLIADHFGIEPTRVAARYNIAPTQEAPVVRIFGATGDRRLDLLHWGLVPRWAEDPVVGTRMINARAETAATRPAFAECFRWRRCLVPADGFYEWKKEGGRRQPYHFRLAGGGLFAFAGLWSRWSSTAGSPLDTFAVLTTEANELVAEVHPRMPVILPPQSYSEWLDPGAGEEPDALQRLLAPLGSGEMKVTRVSTWVSSTANEGARCIAPAEPELPPQRWLF